MFHRSVPSMYYVPDYVAREPEPLRAFIKYIKSKDGMEQRQALKTHFQEAMNELHSIAEVQLLEQVSEALGDNSTRLEILKPFHALSFYLMKQADVDIPSALRATPDVSDQHDREKRCTSLRSNRRNDCRGMCGRKCSCWSWVCGNCCFHQGCFEHDLCCDHDFWSTYCLTPFGFSCGRYKGYPRCLKSFWPWKWGSKRVKDKVFVAECKNTVSPFVFFFFFRAFFSIEVFDFATNSWKTRSVAYLAGS